MATIAPVAIDAGTENSHLLPHRERTPGLRSGRFGTETVAIRRRQEAADPADVTHLPQTWGLESRVPEQDNNTVLALDVLAL